MSSEVPYAADAEVSLSFDDLQVCFHSKILSFHQTHAEIQPIGSPITIREGGSPRLSHDANQVQLCVGSGEESEAGTPSRRRAGIPRCGFVKSVPNF